MALLIDSSVFIDVERRGIPPEGTISLLANGSVALASITASELLAGVLRANTLERQVRREAFVERILSLVPTLPFDLRVARIYARLLNQLREQAISIGANDLQIAATAVTNGYDVLTVNVRDFARVPGLSVRQLP